MLDRHVTEQSVGFERGLVSARGNGAVERHQTSSSDGQRQPPNLGADHWFSNAA